MFLSTNLFEIFALINQAFQLNDDLSQLSQDTLSHDYWANCLP